MTTMPQLDCYGQHPRIAFLTFDDLSCERHVGLTYHFNFSEKAESLDQLLTLARSTSVEKRL